MAHYFHDSKYDEAKKVIESLDPQNERDALILYYIADKQKRIDRLDKLTDEYQEVFNGIGRFLPRSSRDTILG